MDQEHQTWNVLFQAFDLFRKLCLAGVFMLVLAGATQWLPDSEQRESQPLKSNSAESFNVNERILAISATEDGQYVDVVQGNSMWSRRDAHTGRELVSRQLPLRHFLFPKICRKGEWIAGLNECHGLVIFHQLEPVQPQDFDRLQVSECIQNSSLSADGTQIAVVSKQGSLWLMKLDGSQVTTTQHHQLESSCRFVALSPVGDRAALIDAEGRLLIWNVVPQTATPPPLDDNVNCRVASWSDDGCRIITCGWGSDFHVWDAETMTIIRCGTARSQSVAIACLSADGRRAAIANDQSISIWDVESDEELATLDAHEARVTDLKFGNDQVTLFSSDAAGTLRRWSVPDQRLVWSAP